MARPLGFELLWALRHNFILIYFRVFRDISIVRLGEPIDFNLVSLMNMLSASFNMHNRDTKIQLLLANPYSSQWEDRTPTYFSHTKVGGSSSTKGWVRPSQPPRQITPCMCRPTIYMNPIYDKVVCKCIANISI